MIDETIETTKKAFYAAVGAPVVAARRAGDAVGTLNDKVKAYRESFADDLKNEVASWTEEGEKVMTRVSSQPVVEDITSRIDIDAQVGKLRDQLDDLLESWRKSFRPSDPAVRIEVETTEVTIEEPKTAPSKSTAAKGTATKTAGAKTAAASSKTTAKKTTAKKTTTKKTTANNTAAAKTNKAG